MRFLGPKTHVEDFAKTPRLVLSGAVLESHGQGEKQTHRMFFQVVIFPFQTWGKGPQYLKYIIKKVVFPDFFFDFLVSFLFHFKDV